MVYQRKQRAYEQELQRPVPPVQTSLFNSPDLETEEADNSFSVNSSQPGPSMEVRLKQISQPLYTLGDLGSRPVYPSDSAVQRHPMFPSEQAQRTGSLDSHWRRSATRHDFFGSGKPAVQRTKMAAAGVLQRAPKGGAGGAGAVELTPKGSGRPLPKQVSDNFVQSGYPEVQQARVHVNDEATQSIQAHGYTMKNDIVVQSRGANDPKLLAHEATHVVQQSQMALKPDVKDTPLNANPTLEKNADDNSERVVRNEPVSVMGASAQGENGDSAPQPSPATVQPSSLATQTDLQSGRVGGPTLPQQTNSTIQRQVYLSDSYRFSSDEVTSYLDEKVVRSHLLKAGIHEDIIKDLLDFYVTGENSDINNISLSKLLKDAKEENAKRGGKADELEEKSSEIEEEIKPKKQAANALFKPPNNKQGNAVNHDGLSLSQARKYLIGSGIKEPVVDSIIEGYKMEQKYSIPYTKIDEIVKKLSLQEGHYHKIGQLQGSAYDPELSAAIRSLGASLKTPWEFKINFANDDEWSLSKAREYLLNKGIEKQTVDSILKYYEMGQINSIPVKKLYKIAYDLLFQQNPNDVQNWKSPYEAVLNDDEKDVIDISEHDEEEKQDQSPESVTSTSTSASSSMSNADQQQVVAVGQNDDSDDAVANPSDPNQLSLNESEAGKNFREKLLSKDFDLRDIDSSTKDLRERVQWQVPGNPSANNPRATWDIMKGKRQKDLGLADVDNIHMKDLLSVAIYTRGESHRTDNPYNEMNGLLRNLDEKTAYDDTYKNNDKLLETYEPYIMGISSAINNLPPFKGRCFRGSDLPDNVRSEYKEGKTVKEPGFSSASIDYTVVTNGFSGNVFYVIDAAGGGAYISPMSDKGYYEHEVLFPHNSEFKILETIGFDNLSDPKRTMGRFFMGDKGGVKGGFGNTEYRGYGGYGKVYSGDEAENAPKLLVHMKELLTEKQTQRTVEKEQKYQGINDTYYSHTYKDPKDISHLLGDSVQNSNNFKLGSRIDSPENVTSLIAEYQSELPRQRELLARLQQQERLQEQDKKLREKRLRFQRDYTNCLGYVGGNIDVLENLFTLINRPENKKKKSKEKKQMIQDECGYLDKKQISQIYVLFAKKSPFREWLLESFS